jgi:4-methyl-5(b-hydroxyethyl)-thiazole monophosphate biosynthesis
MITSMKHVILLLAKGFEEVEAVTPVDMLRRAGITVDIVAVGNQLLVEGARKIPIMADTLIENLDFSELPDAVICPGGMGGSKGLASSAEVTELLTRMNADGKLIAAICAAPVIVLGALGLLKGKKYTCYPGMEEDLDISKNPNAEHKRDLVVKDGNLLTSQGPGTAGSFSFALIEYLSDLKVSKTILKDTIY